MLCVLFTGSIQRVGTRYFITLKSMYTVNNNIYAGTIMLLACHSVLRVNFLNYSIIPRPTLALEIINLPSTAVHFFITIYFNCYSCMASKYFNDLVCGFTFSSNRFSHLFFFRTVQHRYIYFIIVYMFILNYYLTILCNLPVKWFRWALIKWWEIKHRMLVVKHF